MKTKSEIDFTADIIDVRDIIERIEELDTEYEVFVGDDDSDEIRAAWDATDAGAELSTLLMLMEDLKGYGGDEQWRGEWYPLTLISESYFTQYVEEMLIDCGTIPSDLPSWVHIDWETTAKEVKHDYSTIDINGLEYFYR